MNLLSLALKTAGILILLGAAVLLIIFFCHRSVESAAKGRIYSDANEVPEKKAALVLGCAKTLPNGRGNAYFYHRIKTAASLYQVGKCQYLIVSGDNSVKGYDEPTDMQNELIKNGVPKNRIYRDFAGFRTLDSVVRARDIFGQTDIIVVSQEFHNKRAIFLAKKHGMEAVGLNSRKVSRMAGLKTNLREYLARVKMMLDVYILKTDPKFGGPKVELGGPRPEHGD